MPYLETRKYVANLVVKLRAVSIPENLIDLVQETREVIIETTVTFDINQWTGGGQLTPYELALSLSCQRWGTRDGL
jgi:hypothetical protein